MLFFFIKNTLYYNNMENFKYDTLTINDITKICDNNIYTVNGENPIIYQWLDHQLEYVLEILGIPIIDSKTGLKLTNAEIKNLLESTSESKNIQIRSGNPETDVRMGIVPRKILNTISLNNMGGMPENNYLLSDIDGRIINPEQSFVYVTDKVTKTSNKKKIRKKKKTKN